MSADDAFLKAIAKKKVDNQKPFRDALLFARSVVRTDSGRNFIASCSEQLSTKGFLTERQVEALYELESNGYGYGYEYEDQDDDDDDREWGPC